MTNHPYIRAYMAGIALPTVALLLVLSGFVTFRLILGLPTPVERVIAFPMAVVPNLWGLWNVLFVKLRQSRPWNIGVHGAVLPLVLGPLGFFLGRALGVVETTPQAIVYFGAIHVDYAHLVVGALIAVSLYYLAWKWIVNFFNQIVGVA
jgi:hypothetical protein